MSNVITPKQLAERWACHRTSAVRTMQRLGFAGTKGGKARGFMRRFALRDVQRAEMIMQRHAGGGNDV